MKSEIYTATAMSNDADVALQEAVQKLWRTAVGEYRDRFTVSSLTHAATLVTSAEEVVVLGHVVAEDGGELRSEHWPPVHEQRHDAGRAGRSSRSRNARARSTHPCRGTSSLMWRTTRATSSSSFTSQPS